MISEKTVELNLTTELINWATSVTNRTYYALAPSQRQEAKLGFDAAIQANGTGVLIQYKRAHVNASHWVWHLNRTTLKDQHVRLQQLEKLGISSVAEIACTLDALSPLPQGQRRKPSEPVAVRKVGGAETGASIKGDALRKNIKRKMNAEDIPEALTLMLSAALEKWAQHFIHS